MADTGLNLGGATGGLDLRSARLYSRQIALREIGSEGQARLLAAEVLLVGADMTIDTASRYLASAGVGRLRALGGGGLALDGAGWIEALGGASLVLRSGFDDDAMVRAAVRLAIPVVVVRAGSIVDVLSFRRHGPCPHVALDVPVRAAEPGEGGAAAVLAGTLAAAEAALVLARPAEPPRARHLRLPLDGGDPVTQEIPWAPECFLCGGQSREVVP